MGQRRDTCPCLSCTTSRWRHCSQNTWKQFSIFGCLKSSRQTAQVSRSSNFLSALSATATCDSAIPAQKVVSVDQLQIEVSKHVPPKKVTFMCSKHKDQQLRLYCETCEDLICHDCTVRVHKGHQYDLISDTFDEHKANIKA